MCVARTVSELSLSDSRVPRMNTKQVVSRTIAAAVCALACFSTSHSATPASDIEHLRSVLTSRFPEVKIETIKPSPMPGMYEVNTATDIVYADANGEYVMMGTLLETKTRVNLTAIRWDERNAIDFATLPLDLAIKNVRGNGSRVLAVFSDPHCPYCQKLEKELESLDNTTVYTFLYPIETLHKGATSSAHKVWCATDRSNAWKQWMLNQKEPAATQGCSQDPISTIQALGEKLNIQSTPTLFLKDGKRVTGAMGAAELEERLVAAQPARSAGATSNPKTRSPIER